MDDNCTNLALRPLFLDLPACYRALANYLCCLHQIELFFARKLQAKLMTIGRVTIMKARWRGVWGVKCGVSILSLIGQQPCKRKAIAWPAREVGKIWDGQPGR
jgi:hypothetical protein